MTFKTEIHDAEQTLPQADYGIYLVYTNAEPENPKAGDWTVAVFYSDGERSYFYEQATERQVYYVTHWCNLPMLPA